MDLVEAHAHLARLRRRDRPEIGLQATIAGLDVWCAAATALASLSGMLQDAVGPSGVYEALEHGVTLLNAEIIDVEALHREIERVLIAVLQWGERVTTGN